MKNAALAKALKWLFIAQLLSMVAMLPLVYALKSLLQVAAGLLTLAALVRAAGEASGYRSALGLCVANLAWAPSPLSFSAGLFISWSICSAPGPSRSPA